MRLLILFIVLFCGCSSDLEIGPPCDDSYLYKTASEIPYDIESVKHQLYSTFTPLVKCVRSPDKINMDWARVIYSIPINNASFFEFSGHVAVTNDMSKPMLVSYYFIVADSPFNVRGIALTAHKGTNVTSNMHHGVVGQSGFYASDTPVSGFLNIVVFSASGEEELINENVTVEDNGEMFLIIRE